MNDCIFKHFLASTSSQIPTTPTIHRPKVKRYVIITYKHCKYELLHEFPNDLRLTKIGN